MDNEKKRLTNGNNDADIVIWPELKTIARKIEYGSFLVRFEVHAGRIRLIETSDERRRKSCF